MSQDFSYMDNYNKKRLKKYTSLMQQKTTD